MSRINDGVRGKAFRAFALLSLVTVVAAIGFFVAAAPQGAAFAADNGNAALVGSWGAGIAGAQGGTGAEGHGNAATVGSWGVGIDGAEGGPSAEGHGNAAVVGTWGGSPDAGDYTGPARNNNPALVGTWAAGAADSDGDGVGDDLDRCPGTPQGAQVDKAGCPVDDDGDGVPNGLDQCANTPRGARVDAKGCTMDSDGDGVADGIDQCANTPKGATVDSRGCPADSDGDGVSDGTDQCPNTPRGARVDARGCPTDGDGDGVPDGIDQCDGTPAGVKVDARGCPEPTSQKEAELLDTGTLRLENVYFDSGKATLKSQSNAALDEVGDILVKWPQLRIEVGGHTDSQGADQTNMDLSQKRAQSVVDYLTGKFSSLKADQFTVKGYGETKPVADNGTSDGRAKNRRVEFTVLNREMLRK